MLIWFICVIALVFLDQLSKWLAVIYLEGNAPFYFIPGFLRFSYVENRGAAFGMLADNRWVFLILSSLTIICLIVFLGYVIDFIDFYSIWNYVFNIADSCVCIGVALLILYVIKLSIDEYKASKKAAADEKNADSDSTDGANERTACRAPGRSSTAPSDRPSNHDDDTQ